MRPLPRRIVVSLALLVVPAALGAQQWNAPAAIALARRGIERRLSAQGDTTLHSYRTRAHGFVFFLAQVGEGLREPPRLVKADELDVEVYWRAPGTSKQVIGRWRDGAFLPYGINYHRDHLGIVTNNFGDRIRIGEGDEVRDVIHPLAPSGLDLYDFALEDSTSVESGAGALKVYALQVRPKEFTRPRVVGTLYLSAATAELVRFRFSFTPAAYLDRDLEDISVVLENAIWEQRYWLPRRQEIEIRRRSTWLDFPARGIIRGRWEISDYQLNAPVTDAELAGPAIGGLVAATPGDSGWRQSLTQAVAGVAAPVNRQELDRLRNEVERIAGAHLLSGLPSTRFGAGSVSDVVHVNRVQGLAFGIGGSFGVARRRLLFRPSLGIGTSDGRVTGGLEASAGAGRFDVTLDASRRIRDFSDRPVISPLLNSLTSQEAGDDHGDYVLLDAATATIRRRLGPRSDVALEAGAERSRSVETTATPATGSYRPNPALGGGTYGVARLVLTRGSGGFGLAHELEGSVALEGGTGPAEYLRVAGDASWRADAGPGQLFAELAGGWASGGVPAWRTFAIGGRGTLPGEPFRAYGGRRMALAHLEWRLEVPVPAISFGSFASTGHRATVAPFVAAGWADRPPTAVPWTASDGVRPVAGVALEWLMHLVRLEAGVGLRDGRIGVSVDVGRAWWGIL